MPKTLKESIQDGDQDAIEAALKVGEFCRKVSTEIKAIDRDNFEITFAITTDTLDRDGERVMPKAFESTIKSYLDNPVVLWAHDPRQPVVAQMVSHKITDAEFLATDRFAVKEYEFAAQLWALYSAEPTPFMRATSVGFLPMKTSHEKEDMLPSQRGVTFQEAELLEHSLVPVPSNRLALAKMYPIIKSQIDPLFKDYLDELMDTAEEEPIYAKGSVITWLAGENRYAGVIEEGLTNESKSIVVFLEQENPLAEYEGEDVYEGQSHIVLPQHFFKAIDLKVHTNTTDTLMVGNMRIVPKIGDVYEFNTYKNRDGSHATTWQPVKLADPSDAEIKKITRFADLPMAGNQMRWSWSTSVSNAVLGNNDWTRYKRAHISYDPDDDENKSGYKLPFARIINGSLKAVPRGVFAAMAAVNGARGGVNMPEAERRGAYNHLVRYYDKLDRDPPDFKKDGEIAEMKAADEDKMLHGHGPTIDGSWERDERDIREELFSYKGEVLGFDDFEWLLPFATFPKDVLAWADERDEVYRIDWKRGAGRNIVFTNPRIVEADFNGDGETVEVIEMANDEAADGYRKEEESEAKDENTQADDTDSLEDLDFTDEQLAQLQAALEGVQNAQREIAV